MKLINTQALYTVAGGKYDESERRENTAALSLVTSFIGGMAGGGFGLVMGDHFKLGYSIGLIMGAAAGYALGSMVYEVKPTPTSDSDFTCKKCNFS